MLWSIKTKNTQIINFNHDQLINDHQKECQSTKEQQSVNFLNKNQHKKMQIKKSFQQLMIQIQNYKPLYKYIDLSSMKCSPYLQIKKYRQCIYYGQIIQNKRQGQGIILYTNSRLYQGQWKDNFKNGKGYQIFANNSIYYGSYLKGKPNGYGKYQWQNGQIYQGQWINGLKEGSGIWRGSKGDSYIGQWKNGRANGYGVHTWINGNRYQGEFLQCLKHGQGIEKFANGDTYKGSYQNGKPHGQGQYNWNDGSSYKGNFINGLRNGKGIWKKSKNNSDTYQGQFIDQKKQGYGTFIWANGSKYIGNFKNDMRQGYGQMCWIDGNIYKGEWINGQQCSQNLYFHSQQLFNQFPNNPLEDIIYKHNPESFQQFQQTNELNYPQIIQNKKFRSRDISRIRSRNNQNFKLNLNQNYGGFKLSQNIITQSTTCRKPSTNTSKLHPKLGVKGQFVKSNIKGFSTSRIRHCQSTSQKKKMNSTFSNNFMYINNPNRRSGIKFDADSSSRSSKSSFIPKQRLIKSSSGMRNTYKTDNSNSNLNFIQEMKRNRQKILNNQEQNQIKLFSRSKNKSQIF